jgi:membrane associated rhomboid family serine protease
MPRLHSITITLIIITIGIFATQQLLEVDMINLLGLRNFASDLFKPYQLFTHLFVHANFMHLLNNTFAFYTFGPIIESTLGNKDFLKFYLITGLGSALIYSSITHIELSKKKNMIITYTLSPSPEAFEHCINQFDKPNIALNKFTDNFYLNPHQDNYIRQSINILQLLYKNKADTPVIGSSGIAFALMTAMAMIFPNLKLFIILFPLPIKAKYFVAAYGLYELYSGIKYNHDNVAHFAHIAGIIISFIFTKWWMHKTKTTPL